MNINPINHSSFKGVGASIAKTSVICGAVAAGIQGASNLYHYSKNKEYYSNQIAHDEFKKSSRNSMLRSAIGSAILCTILNGASYLSHKN